MLVDANFDICCHSNAKAILSSTIFRGVGEENLSKALKCLKGRFVTFGKDEVITGGRNMAIVLLSGCVSYSFLDEDSGRVNIRNIASGETFFPSSSTSPEHRATRDSSALILDLTKVMGSEETECPLRRKLSRNTFSILQSEKEELEKEVRIIAQRRLRDKIRLYLEECEIDEDGSILLKYSRNDLAEHLYADRSALSREMGRMRDEGKIEISGNCVKVIDPTFLSAIS